MLAWNEYDFVECLGVLTEYEEDSQSSSYEVEKDGLRLLLTIFDGGGVKSPADVYLSIYRDGIKEPIFHTTIYKSPGAHRVIDANGFECLEIAAPSRYNSHYEENWIVPMWMRVRVYPHICAELFQPEEV